MGEEKTPREIAIIAIIRAEHDGNGGLSNAKYHIASAREALREPNPNIDMALEKLKSAENSLRYTYESIGDLWKAEDYIKKNFPQ